MPKSIQVRILTQVDTLGDGIMANRNGKKLINSLYNYRLRVGTYRVFFNVYNTIEIISIEEVKKRDERT